MDPLDLGATIKGFSPGQKVFTRYTLRKILGRGGMGVVWLARDEELEREVALKFLPEVVAMDKQSINELKRETRRSLELTHPHIIRIYDFVQDGRAAAISMEFVAGDTLASLKADRPGHCFEVADIEKWIRQLCEALAYAHGKAHVVHRDLKPANLMVDARGDLKVADFGIAASVSDSISRVSAQGSSSGTPVYMSPQQMMGEKPAVTDDIYSVGATLYDLLTGKPPFHSGNIIAQVQAKVPPAMAPRRAELGHGEAAIPAAWEAAVAACLAKEPAERPQSAAEVWERLSGEGGTRSAEVAAAPAPVRVEVPARPSPQVPVTPVRPAGAAVAEPSRKKSLGPWVAAALTLVVALGLAGWWFGVHVPAQQREAEQARIAAEEKWLADARALLARATAEVEDFLFARQWDQAAARLDNFATAARDVPELERPAWTEAERRLRGQLAEGREKARLAALRIPVTLRTNPSGAEILVDGQSRGLAPVTALPLSVGEHKVTARLADHEELDHTLTVSEHSQTEWTLPLVRSTGRLRLTAVPAGASFEVLALKELLDGHRTKLAQTDFLGAKNLFSKSLISESEMRQAERDYAKAIESIGPVVRQGTLPVAELDLPTGPYLVRVYPAPGALALAHTDTIMVKRGETVAIDADVRAASLQINSTPAGAVVVVDGKEVGRTPFLLADAPHNSHRRVELRAEGYESVLQDFTLSREKPETWNATLREAPRMALRSVFANGPRLVEVSARVDSVTSGRTVAAGQTTPIPENRTNTTMTSRYEVLAVDAQGLVRSARSVPESTLNGVAVFRPGTTIQFDRNGGAWVSSVATGGFVQEGMSVEFFTPGYPLMWLDEQTLPAGPATVGRTWDVPLSATAVLLPSMRFVTPSGSIRARVTAADLSPAAGWAEVEFAFELSGQLIIPEVSRRALVAGQAMTMEGRYSGTMTLRLELAKGYVSRGRIRHTGSIDNRVTGGTGTAATSLLGAVAKAAQSASGNVIAQTTMDLTTDVEFTVAPANPGAALVSSAAPAAAKVPVVFYRKNNAWVGTGAHFNLYVAGERIATLRDGEYYRTELPLDTRQIEVGQQALGREWNRTRAVLALTAGRDNYYEVGFTMAGPVKVEERTVAEGTAGIAKLKASAGSDQKPQAAVGLDSGARLPEAPLVLFRESRFIGMGVDHGVKINGRWIAVLKNGEYKQVLVPAGRITVESHDVVRGGFDHATVRRLELEVAHDRVNYLETQYSMNGAPGLRPHTDVDPAPVLARLREAADLAEPRPHGI